jgi:hypothetical protein
MDVDQNHESRTLFGPVSTGARRGTIGAIMTGAASSPPREEDDFYPTPWEGTESFLRAEGHLLAHFFRKVWEPACGNGAISEVMRTHGLDVVSTDLIDRHYRRGDSGIDFLKTRGALAPAIVTNPPYMNNLPEAFVRHARRIGVRYVALLLKADFWNAQTRMKFWDDLPPARCYPLSFRLDFMGRGRPVMNCTWFVWDWAMAGTFREKMPFMRILPKPAGAQEQTNFFRGGGL